VCPRLACVTAVAAGHTRGLQGVLAADPSWHTRAHRKRTAASLGTMRCRVVLDAAPQFLVPQLQGNIHGVSVTIFMSTVPTKIK
jgi:hypothetical protein